MYYTIVPIEWLLEDEEEEHTKTERREVMVNGVRLIVERTKDTYKIVQLISSDPSHYLNEAYQPGRTLSLRPLL